MAITQVALSRPWYTYGNAPFIWNATDYSLSAANVTKMWNWLLKELLLGNYVGKGGNEGPNGARPAGSLWTVRYSCDSVVAGTAGDGIDRWVDPEDIVGGVEGTGAHSWIVLRSPQTWGQNGTSYVEMLISRSVLAGGTLADRYGLIYFSINEPFTGGTTTARPTSTKEFPGTKFWTGATNRGQEIYLGTTYTNLRRMSITFDAKGRWYMAVHIMGGGSGGLSCCMENDDADPRDVTPIQTSICFLGSVAGFNSRKWDNNSEKFWYISTSTHKAGSFILPVLGNHDCQTSEAVFNGIAATLGYYPADETTGAPRALSQYTTTEAGVDKDGNAISGGQRICLPIQFLEPTNSGDNEALNRPQWRGVLPDAWWILSQGLGYGDAYPGGDLTMTHAFMYATQKNNGGWLMPFNVPLAT